MRRRLSVFAVLLAGAAVLTPPAAAAAAAPEGVTLPTGERIAVRTTADGRFLYDVRPAAEKGMARALVHLRLGDRDYEVPATALPYLGRGLDLGLFDVKALLAGAAAPVDPARFGAALAKQFKEDNAKGRFGGQGLFAGGKTFALSGTPARRAAQPRSVMRTVSVDATDIAGRPADTGVAFLYNTDDGNLLDPNESLNYFAGGTAKFSAPDGNYSALGLFWTADADGNPTEVRFSAQPEFAVKADKTVRVDASRASSKLTWVTPRPALLDDTGFLFRRAAKTGPALLVDFDAGPGVPIAVSPTAVPVRTGALQTYPYSRLVSPPGPGTPYEYVLQKASTGTIPRQRYVITANDVAAVDSTYFSEYASLGLRQRSGMFSFEDSGGRVSHPIQLPRRQVEYVSAAPDLRWFGGFSKYLPSSQFPGWAGGQYEAFHVYRGGSAVTEDWNKFPLHPVGGVALLPLDDGTAPMQPAATRAGDLLRVSITPFSDNEPGHTGFGLYGEARDTITGHYTLTQDGTTIAEESPAGVTELTLEQAVAPGPSTLGLTVDAGRTGPMYHQSTATHTEWTWPSQHVEGSTLPAALVCVRQREGVDRSCGAEPMLTLGYAVGGLRPDGSTVAGPQGFDLTVGHLQQSAASPVTGATAQYSLDGTTWHDATVTPRGDGVFHAEFTAVPESFRGGDVSLRVTAADAAGATVSETITAAYHVYPS
ncbi:hypothetical protein M8542_13110 [Amycolatopsis sp. OK19-0408]|uniref:Uncharacterized protein n=1 Tax=Amycolatopsis iheyensis TaxID=2945988 RepID=A0A9X2SJ87_9PSEU|nr:hypothetical protein [Amycolatopsis iheyensis]MCR6483758.1 hypothetical protein [Amycolatopsis iheyensis]